MNEIAKKATADKFLRALEKEQLTKAEAGACIGFTPANVSYLLNDKYWDRLGIYWDKILAWVNSGQSLREYSEKHGKVLPPEKPVSKKIIDPVAEALWEQSVRNVAKEKEFKPVDFTPEMKDKIDNAEKLAKHPYFSGVEEQVQKVRIDIEINLVINGQRIKLA